MISPSENKEEKKNIKICFLFKIRNSNDAIFDYLEKDVFHVKHETSEERIFYFRTNAGNKIINSKDAIYFS